MIFEKLDQKDMNFVTAHPRLFSVATGFVITLTVGIAIGMVDHQQVFAARQLPDNSQHTSFGACY
jgi:hypothetical protein